MDKRIWKIARSAAITAALFALGKHYAAPADGAVGSDSAENASGARAVPGATNVQSAADATIAALDALDAWLGAGPNGDKWRAYLRTDAARSELAKGADADPATVARTLQHFHGDANGLDLAPFRAARDAITRQLASMKHGYTSDLARLAWASRGDHTPISAAQFAAIRADLRSKASALDRALVPNSKLSQGWKKYLQWDLLTPHLADGYQPTAESLGKLDEVLRRFRTNELGLERPVFTDVAKAIERYRALAPWAVRAMTADSRTDYERIVTNLERLLERHLERPTVETVRQVSRGLGVLAHLGQSPELVAAMRREFVHPNVYGAVSANFVMRSPNRPIDRTMTQRDCILGTAMFSHVHTLGGIQYNLINSDDSVELAIYLQGAAHSRTRGVHKPVVIHTTGVTNYWAEKRISFTDEAFDHSSPIASDANLNTRIHSIQKMGGRFGERLIEKIAWQRAYEQKRQAERISASHTRERVVREFEETVARDLGLARQRYEEKVRWPLVRRGVTPEYLQMRSSAEGVSIETLFGTAGQLGAPGARPAPMPGHDIVVQIHESAINNYMPLALASARIAQQTADNPPMLEGNVPTWLKALSVARPNLAAAASAGAEIVDEAQERIQDLVGAEPEAPPPPFKAYSITLNGEAPVSVRFDDNQVAIRVRASVLASEDSEYHNWDFIVTYAIRQEGERILLTRVGEIEAFPTGFDPEWPRQLTAEETGFRSVLKKNMNARANAGQSFPKDIPIEPVRVSRFGVLVLEELIADNGWLTVGWRLP